MRFLQAILLGAIIITGCFSIGFYYYNSLNDQNIQGSSASNGNSSSNQGNTSQCLNGTVNYPACSTCPNGENLNGNHCTIASGANLPICSNGATDRSTCLDCPPSQSLVNGSCINNCSNGQVNPPFCDGKTANCHDSNNVQSHLYSPERLTVIIPCVTVTGIVAENGGIDYNNNDGDTIVGLIVDSQFSSLVNSGDQRYISGHLQTEIICSNHNAPSLPRECSNYASQILVPKEKQHVIITGPYVQDTNHYNWGEIHPVYSLTVTPVHNSTISENLYVQYPNHESNGWLGPSYQSHAKSVTIRDGLVLVDNFTFTNPTNATQQISDIYLDTPNFTIHSISPNPTITINSHTTVTIVLIIDTPYWYNIGPLNIHFVVSGP